MNVRDMTVGQKASLSLLIAVILFAALSVAAFSGLFNIVESDFFSPSISRGLDASLDRIAARTKSYHELNIAKFKAILGLDAIKRSFLPNSSAEDVQNRAFAFGKLQEDIAGLSGLRIVDAGGKRIQYSTIPGDVTRRIGLELIYRNYGDPGDSPFDSIAALEGTAPSISLDSAANRFVYSLPFSDGFGDYRGTALFYVGLDGLTSLLVKEGLSAVEEAPVVIPGKGLLLRAPLVGRDQLVNRVAEVWSAGPSQKPLAITSDSSGGSYVLFTKSAGVGGYMGFVIPSSAFALPSAMKWLLLGSFFITAYLLCFLLLNLRQDRMTVLSDRIKRFQISLLEEYVDNKSDIDFGRWRRELEARRADVHGAIKRSIGRVRPRVQPEVDELIDKSWDEILAILGGRAGGGAAPAELGGASIKEIERLLAEALKSGTFVLPAGAATGVAPGAPASAPAQARPALQPGREPVSLPAAPGPATTAEPVEELGEAESVEELEEVEAVEELAEAEPVEELAEAEPEAGPSAEPAAELAATTAEPVEELGEAEPSAVPAAEPTAWPAALEAKPAPEPAAATAEPVEELGEAESVEELEEVEAVEELDEAEPAAAPSAEPAVELAEAEPVEELPAAEPAAEPAAWPAALEAKQAPEPAATTAEPVEELGEAESVEELEEVESVEELAEAEPVEELANAEPVEELAEAEPSAVPAAEPAAWPAALEAKPALERASTTAEPVEELGEAESVEELEAVEAVEELAEAEPVEELAEAEPAALERKPAPEPAAATAEPVEELAEAERAPVPSAEPTPAVGGETLPMLLADEDESRFLDELPEWLRAPAPAATPVTRQTVAAAPESATQAEPEEFAELEPLEDLETLGALEELASADEGEGFPEKGERISASTRAYQLAVDLDDDIPVIPESSGLELADEADITDIIGFIDVDENARVEELSALDDDLGLDGEAPMRYGLAPQEPEFIMDAAEEVEDSGLEPLEEIEFQLLLSTIDLSSLEQWERGPAGAAEADATRSTTSGFAPASPSVAPSVPPSVAPLAEPALILPGTLRPDAPESPHFARSEAQDLAGESDDSVIVGDEIPMLTDEMRELLEFLPAVELEDGAPLDLFEYLGPALRYRPPSRLEAVAQPASEDLPVIGEGEPWSEAEYLGDGEAADAYGEPADTAPEEGEEGPILYKDGLFQLNPDFPASGVAMDNELKNLVNSVLGGDQGA